ncbi:hypothetical protein BJV77DRAFT_240878 [Russula vinacea]|nr:hypothetical protein BJV77DRAFT_240878 [Russula vinacea]
MRSTTVVSFFIASWILAFQSPTAYLAAYAAPVPSQANSAGIVKRVCLIIPCKSEEPSNTDTTSQSSDAENLAEVLMDALQTYKAQNTPANTDTTADFITPQDAEAEPVPVVDAMELADAAL